MDKVSFTLVNYNADFALVLDYSCNVGCVVVKLASVCDGEITVKYAQNGVTSDLLTFGTARIDRKTELEISVKTPVSASHIYIIPSDKNINISDIEVYEDKNEFTNKTYPVYRDVDLKENYYLDTVSVFTSDEGYSHYSIYTSMDGRDFELLAQKNTDESCDMTNGDIYYANGKEARIIRVYIEYNSESPAAVLSDVRFSGTKSNTEIVERAKLNIPAFKNSKYDVEITTQDTYDEVYGIIERRLGKEYKAWFDFLLCENPVDGHDFDYFEIENAGKKILVKGNCGVSLAAGLNHYLKYYCRVNISQVGDQIKMPKNIVQLPQNVFKETKAKVRYSYNYCTLSYSMAFWGKKEWRDELDWLALNGVNVVLDATAQEEVWRRFLTELGYTHEEIKKYIAGPAYYAWAYMANLYGFGGPVHDSWFSERTELARENHLIMRKLGMYPVLQGYSGMVPIDIEEHDKNAEVIPQGTWGAFVRPYMLKTTSGVFCDYAKKFYKAQSEVYGDYSKYFATDPFHEGGNRANMSERNIAHEVLGAMLNANKEAVWVIQSWQGNPSSELLAGLDEIKDGKQHALVLDLYAEKLPNYKNGCAGNEYHGYTSEFDKTPWLFCMLNNFGGRLGLHGHLDNMANWIPQAFNSCEKIAGIGITPEASVNNPVLYDFLFECVWVDNADMDMEVIDLEVWLHEYAARRYGAVSMSANKAWDILLETVYKAEKNNLGQGAPECVFNARPALTINAASTWGNAIISYDKKELKKAAELLLEDYDILKCSDGYLYDLTTVLQQVLSNAAQDYYDKMIRAYDRRDLEEFEAIAEEFLKIADDMESVTGSNEYYLLGRWVEQAKELAQNADDFTKKLYEFNAKALITTWGAYNESESGLLHDYSNRQWSGLIRDFYKPRWERWIGERIKELKNEPFEKDINWFAWEWKWVRGNEVYTTRPMKVNLGDLGKKILARYK